MTTTEIIIGIVVFAAIATAVYVYRNRDKWIGDDPADKPKDPSKPSKV